MSRGNGTRVCENCIYCEFQENPIYEIGGYYECRKSAIPKDGIWPPVKKDDWCGEIEECYPKGPRTVATE